MSQRSLPFQRHSLTSIEAAHQARESGSAARYREVVYAAICGAPDGLTDEGISVLTRLPGNTARPRRVELLDAGRIKDSGRRRETLSGRKAVIWTVA